MSEWKEYKLGDVCVRLSSGKSISLKDTSSVGDFPIFGGNGTRGYSHKSNFEGECAIIGRQGAYCGNVRYFKGKAYMTEHAVVMIANAENNTRFLSYFLSLQNLGNLSAQSAQPGISVKTLSKQKYLLPPITEQERIVGILSSLDDKIDLLNRQNQTLESMADALFRHYFIDNVKPEWVEGKLMDLITVKYGKDHKKVLDGKIPIYGSGGIMRYGNQSLYEKESVLIPRKGSLGNIIYINSPFWSVDTMFYTEMKQPNISKYIYHFVKNQDIASMNVGSAVPSMTSDILNNMPIDIPPDYMLLKFECEVSNWYNKMSTNNKQIITLTDLRDTLLPKLMNREIESI